MNPGQRGDRERRLREMVEVVLGEPGLVDHDHRLRRRAVDERERHRRIGRVIERALALDDHPIAQGLALLDEPFHRALGEVADEPVDGHAPALDHHPGLAGRHEDRGLAGRERRTCAARGRPTSCRWRSRSRRSGSPACPGRGGARPPSPSAPAAGGSRRSRCRGRAAAAANSGSSPMNVCRPLEDVEAGADRGEDGRPPCRAAACRRSGRSRSAASPAGSGAPAPRPASPRSGCRGRAGTRSRSGRPGSSRARPRRRRARSGSRRRRSWRGARRTVPRSGSRGGVGRSVASARVYGKRLPPERRAMVQPCTAH